MTLPLQKLFIYIFKHWLERNLNELYFLKEANKFAFFFVTGYNIVSSMFGHMLGTIPSQEHVKKSITVEGLGALRTRDERALGTRGMRCIYPGLQSSPVTPLSIITFLAGNSTLSFRQCMPAISHSSQERRREGVEFADYVQYVHVTVVTFTRSRLVPASTHFVEHVE